MGASYETFEASVASGETVLPDYDRACVSNVVPALLEHPAIGQGWIPQAALDAKQVVLLVIDGLGWTQLVDRPKYARTLLSGEGGPITTVAPSTTAAALTSISIGIPPGEHGLIGYRMRIAGEVLNTLRWTTGQGDARERIPPTEMQPLPAFGGRRPLIVDKAEFRGSGFTDAHLADVRFCGYGTPATMVHEVAMAIDRGERFVYAYYDGLDRTGHERGHDQGYDAEFLFVDRMVADLRRYLGDECALLVTADHGQVDCGTDAIELAPEITSRITGVSGEDRFVWLHSRSDANVLLDVARDAHAEHAFVMGVDEVIERGLLGRKVTDDARSRLGDVALIARDRHALVDPAANRLPLIGRHGGLTRHEMLVPLLSI